MSASTRFEHDARLAAFQERYGSDLIGFAEEVCGIPMVPAHKRAYGLAEAPGSYLIVVDELASSDCPPVSWLAPIALWRMLCQPAQAIRVVLPHPRRRKQYDALLREVMAGPHGWVCGYIMTSMNQIYIGDRWSGPSIQFMTPAAPNELAGFYGDWLVEDAHAVEADYLDVIMGDRQRSQHRIALCVPDLPHDLVRRLAPGKWSVARVEWEEVLQTVAQTPR
ncbi:hypothetical protein [Pseudomonas gingeri]|uniref:hypothetical protein n=1 Tax=Pseudomonas gingeri TaxID=117681 RepID=UPI0015A3A15D|nr:hypothetical protein [Pseudomonas gingeri]NWA11990.1 hypothetical protein [Pseudomonas gingeri]